MARMSIDDKFLRDPRVTQLGLDLGWSRWETMGRLLAVFAVCYDLERDVITPAQVDLAAERPGFADALFACDLAVTTRRGLRIRGVKKRIEYLAPKREAGRQGGIKSGESRRNSAKQKREIREATVNPPDPVPDVVPDPDPVPDLPDPDLSPARVAPPAPEPAPRPAPMPQPGDPALAQRQALRADLWRELGAARTRVAARLNVAHQPLLAQDPGERSLAMLLVEAGDQLEPIAAAARNAIAVAAAEAERDQDLKWLTGVVFDPRNFRRLAAGDPKAASRPRPSKPGDPVRMPARRADPSPPVVVVSDADRADAAAELVAARTRLFGVVDGGRT